MNLPGASNDSRRDVAGGSGRPGQNPFQFRYLWLLPLSWSVVCWVSFYHPGDEYFFWVAGSRPGIWAVFVRGNHGDIREFLMPVLAAGAVTMTVAGLVLDGLRVPIRWFLGGWFSVTIILFIAALLTGELKRATTPAEGLAAYSLAAVNVGLWLNALLLLLGQSGKRGIQAWFRRLHPPGTQATS